MLTANRNQGASSAAPSEEDTSSFQQLSIPARRLGERLLEERVISPEQLAHALKLQSRELGKFSLLGEILVSLGYVPARQMTSMLSEITGTPSVDLPTYPIDRNVAQLLPEETARQRLALPLRIDDTRIWVAMDDPLDRETLHFLADHTKRQVIPLLALLTDLLPAMNYAYAKEGADVAPLPAPTRPEILAGPAQPTFHATEFHMESRTDGVLVRFRDADGWQEQFFPAGQAPNVLVVCCTPPSGS